MVKRKITEYAGIVIILLCVILIFLRFYWVAAIVYVLWYILFGFVGLAFYFSSRRKIALSNLFIRITVHPTLLPFGKSFYFWTKSVNLILKDSTNIKKAYSLAEKVNIDNLYIDNNKAMFCSYLASLYNDLGEKTLAEKYIQIAQNIPHNKMLDETINRLIEEIAKPG